MPVFLTVQCGHVEASSLFFPDVTCSVCQLEKSQDIRSICARSVVPQTQMSQRAGCTPQGPSPLGTSTRQNWRLTELIAQPPPCPRARVRLRLSTWVMKWGDVAVAVGG